MKFDIVMSFTKQVRIGDPPFIKSLDITIVRFALMS